MSSIYTEESASKDFIDIDDLHDINDEKESICHNLPKIINSLDDVINIDQINLTNIDEENLKKVLNDINESKKENDNIKIYLEEKSSTNLKEIEENDDICFEYESRIEEEIYQEYKTREKDRFKAFLNEISQYPLDAKNFNERINISLADMSRQCVNDEEKSHLSQGVVIKEEKDLDKTENDMKSKPLTKENNIVENYKNKIKFNNDKILEIDSQDEYRKENKSELYNYGGKIFLNGYVLKKIINDHGDTKSNVSAKNKINNNSNFFPYNLTDEDIFKKYTNIQNTNVFKQFLLGHTKATSKLNSNSILNQISNRFNREKENNFKPHIYSSGSTSVKDSPCKNKAFNSRYLTAYLTTSNSNTNPNTNINSTQKLSTPKNNPMSHSLTKFVSPHVNKDSSSKLDAQSKNLNENNPNTNQNKFPTPSPLPHPALEIYKNHIKEEKMKYLILKEENIKISKNFEASKQKLQETEKKTKSEIDYLKNQILSLEDENKIWNNKYKESKVNLNKFNSELSEKNSHLEDLNSEISNLEKKLSNTLSENSYLKYQLENTKSELSYNINENTKKNEKISELQERMFNSEQEANDIRSRTSTEINNLRENKQNFDSLKTNFFEVKNQYELLNMKYQTINDENFNLKRDLLLYEKEMRIKNETIQKLRNEMIESNKKSILNDSTGANGNNLNLNLNLNNYMKSGKEKFEKSESWSDNHVENKNIISREDNFGNNGNKTSTKILENKNNFNIITNVKRNITDNEGRSKIVEDQYFALNKEREKIKGQLNKLPEFPKKRDQMELKKELEDKIEIFNKDLGKLKQEMKELAGKNREA